MNRLLEAAKNMDKIKQYEYKVVCPLCGDRQHALFEKLYVYSYGKCVDCSTIAELGPNGDNIFAIL